MAHFRFDGPHKLMYCENYKIGFVLQLSNVYVYVDLHAPEVCCNKL